jgi:hypothetical protein
VVEGAEVAVDAVKAHPELIAEYVKFSYFYRKVLKITGLL